MRLPSLRRLVTSPVTIRRPFLTELGRLWVFLFIVEVVTGLLLAHYYEPSAESAFRSVQFIANEVTFGWLVRSAHLTAGHGLVVISVLILARSFAGRWFLRRMGFADWVVTVVMFLVTVTFFLTGEALPWDQTAYWRTVLTANLVAETPLFGEWLSSVFRGGSEVTGTTLVRLYNMHALVLPWLAVMGVLQVRRLVQRRRES